MANQGVPEEYAGNGLEHRQDKGWREHVSAEGEWENEKNISGFTGTFKGEILYYVFTAEQLEKVQNASRLRWGFIIQLIKSALVADCLWYSDLGAHL